MSPDEVLQKLKEGNQRFVANELTLGNNLAQKRMEANDKGQFPHTAVLSCSDSRVPPELVFDQGIGDIFVVRVAGNVTGLNVIGSMEFAVKKLGTPALVVLGHTQCGAVTAAYTKPELPVNVDNLIEPIKPLADKTRELFPEAGENEIVNICTAANIERSIDEILQKSEVIREKVESGEVKIFGGVYNLETGKVEWVEDE